MDDFLKRCFSSVTNFKKEKLPGDGGHRNYIRIRSDEKTFILMSCGKQDTSLKQFIEIQKRLEPFVSVPKIFHKDLNLGLLLLEDLGDQNLEQYLFEKGKELSTPFYYQALTQLIGFQTEIKPLKTDPLFDKDFFLKENEMAVYHLQTYVNQACKQQPAFFNEKSSINFKKDMEKILSNFKEEDFVYCHRDYHSRNLMLKAGQIVLIDFQDAGLGSWYYDLTSLLYDSYVPLDTSNKKDLATFYFDNLPVFLKKKAQSLFYIEFMTKLQFLQRGFKACGCFAAFKNRDNKSTHLKYIKPTLKLLQEEALKLSYQGIHQYTKQLTEALEELSIQ